MGTMYPIILKIQKAVTYNQARPRPDPTPACGSLPGSLFFQDANPTAQLINSFFGPTRGSDRSDLGNLSPSPTLLSWLFSLDSGRR